MASRIARIALSTEAQPLMPHAQGTSAGRAAATRTRAKGNGRPMKNASGAISTSDAAILSVSGSGINQRNSDGAATRCSTAAATMPATASASAGCRTPTTHRQRPSPPVKRISAAEGHDPCNASSRAVNLGAKPLFYHKMPRLPNHPSIIITAFSTHDEVREADGYKFSSATMSLALGDHAGTHVD